MRIALYGGSFNPVHKAHIRVAEYAIKKLNLDLLIFIPCYQSVDKPKSEYVDSKHRCNMLSLVLIPKSEVSTFEIDKKKPLQSIETMRYFRNKYKDDDLFFIIGEDNLLTIDTWESFEEFDKLVNLVIFKRKTNSKFERGKLNLNLIWMDNELWDCSSKDFRNTGDFSLLDERVEEYVKKFKLYNF